MQPTISAMQTSARSGSTTRVASPAMTAISVAGWLHAVRSARRALSSMTSMAYTRDAPASAAAWVQSRSGPQPISSTVAPGTASAMALRNSALRRSSSRITW
jgi:hypothetical protein